MRLFDLPMGTRRAHRMSMHLTRRRITQAEPRRQRRVPCSRKRAIPVSPCNEHEPRDIIATGCACVFRLGPDPDHAIVVSTVCHARVVAPQYPEGRIALLSTGANQRLSPTCLLIQPLI